MSELTNKQQRFVAEYMVDLNATQAAIRAGYSAKSAARFAVELLNKRQVAAAVEKARLKLAVKLERTAVDVLRDIQEVTREAREARDHRTALKGLELEGKHLGMFVERLDHGGAVELIIGLPRPEEMSSG